MLGRLGNMPIRQKLVAITMLTTVVALVAARLASAVTESMVFRDSVLHEATALAKIVGSNSIGALQFDDPQVAEETLGSLASVDNVRAAVLYTADGVPLASYTKPEYGGTTPARAPGEKQVFSEEGLVTSARIAYRGTHVGTIYLELGLDELYTRLKRMARDTLIILAGTTMLALLLAAKLQGVISEPIMSLVDTVARVTRHKDYSVRVREGSRDELGELIQGFNGMLERIQTRDEELRRARDGLEARVEARTEQLRQEIRVRRAAESDLRKAHDELEQRVEERTAQLARANDNLRAEVTVRREAESELDARNRDLETLLYVTSHDLREPLRAIRNFSRIVVERYADKLDAKGQDFLRRVTRATERLDRLIEDILTLSRAQRMDLQTESIAGREIVDDIIKRLEGMIEEKHAKITVAETFPVYTVSKMWATQAVYNFVANALKFNSEGRPPEVAIAPFSSESDGGTELGFVVADRGPGVDEEQATKIFELFKRAHGREVEGTGAGLAIVRQIAERHGGRAWVQPREGGGSEFVITFAQKKESGSVWKKVA